MKPLAMKPLAILSTALLSLGIASASPALARDNGAGPITVTKEGLEVLGYSCDLVALGVYKCTKPGEGGYVCNSSGCTSLPNRVQGTRFPRAPIQPGMAVMFQ